MDFKGFYDEIIFDVDRSMLKSYQGKQGDTKSRGLYITVTQKNAVIEDLTGLSMRLFYKKPDKTRGFIDGVVDGNKFRIDYTNQMYAVPGVVKAELRLMGADDEVITAKTFKILVDASIADGSIVSKDERGILDRAFELAEDILPRIELLDVELLEDVQDEMLGARHSNTKDESYDSLGQRLDAAEQDLLDHKAEYTSNRQQDQLKVAKVERKLNDYQKVMSMVNVNQEPKQKVSGYGTVSLPKNAANGQISVTLKGRTVNNLMGTDGDCEDTSKFTAMNCTLALNTTNKVFGNNGIKVTIATGQTQGIMSYNIFSKLNKAKYYLITAYLKKGNCTDLKLRLETDDVDIESSVVIATSFTRVGIVVQPSDIDTATSTVIQIIVNGAEGQYGYVDGIMVNEITSEEYALGAAVCMSRYNYHNSTKSTISAMRIRSVSSDETQQSEIYIPNIGELRSLPNGVKDEVSVVTGEVTKSVSDEVSLWELPIWNEHAISSTENFWSVFSRNIVMQRVSGSWSLQNYPSILNTITYPGSYDATDNYCSYVGTDNGIYLKIPKTEIDGTVDSIKIRTWLQQKQVSLTYQLATPITTPVDVSGTLLSYPSGTIYTEPIIADAGIYTDKMEVLYSDFPIKVLEKISKVDFDTGLETELDITAAVIAEDKLSFTHPDLVEGDIVFFVYEYNQESTEGETEIEYYDSRYVIKDSVTERFYKWHIAVADGVPSIELVEV